MEQKSSPLKYFPFLTFILMLPFINILALAYILFTKLTPELSTMISTTTVVLTITFLITLCLSCATLFRLLSDMAMIMSGLRTLIPTYILNAKTGKGNYKKTDFFNIGNDALFIIKKIANYIRDIHLERTNLQDTKIEIELDSIYDVLCKNVFNRSHTEKMMHKKIANLETSTELAIAILDIDHFKNVNDTYGHDAGDHILIEVTSLLLSGLRDGDILGRWGGEEFCIILETPNLEIAESIFERLRASIEANEYQYTNPEGVTMSIPCTMSIGFTFYHHHESADLKEDIKRADTALYHSKENGRNRVTFLND